LQHQPAAPVAAGGATDNLASLYSQLPNAQHFASMSLTDKMNSLHIFNERISTMDKRSMADFELVVVEGEALSKKALRLYMQLPMRHAFYVRTIMPGMPLPRHVDVAPALHDRRSKALYQSHRAIEQLNAMMPEHKFKDPLSNRAKGLILDDYARIHRNNDKREYRGDKNELLVQVDSKVHHQPSPDEVAANTKKWQEYYKRIQNKSAVIEQVSMKDDAPKPPSRAGGAPGPAPYYQPQQQAASPHGQNPNVYRSETSMALPGPAPSGSASMSVPQRPAFATQGQYAAQYPAAYQPQQLQPQYLIQEAGPQEPYDDEDWEFDDDDNDAGEQDAQAYNPLDPYGLGIEVEMSAIEETQEEPAAEPTTASATESNAPTEAESYGGRFIDLPPGTRYEGLGGEESKEN
jgi:hypothetical protein